MKYVRTLTERLRWLFAFTLTAGSLVACASLLAPSREPCPPSTLASIDMRFATEAIATCKLEGATADTCKALPAIRAKYAKERAAYVECSSGAGGAP